MPLLYLSISHSFSFFFIISTSYLDTYKWVHSSAYSSIPADAVIGGNDTDGAIMYVGRAFHNGDTLVAKVLPSKHIAFVSLRGEEIPKEHFEVLCGENLIWRHCYEHIVPENAVLCGETSLGQPVYIGRGHYNGSLTVGKISSVHRALFIPYNGSEKRLESYEILVHEKGPTPGWAIPVPLEEKKPLAPLEEDLKPFPPPPPPYSPVFPTPTAVTQSPPTGPPPPYAAFTYTPQEIKPTYVPSYGTAFTNAPQEIKPAYVPSYGTAFSNTPQEIKPAYVPSYGTAFTYTPQEIKPSYVPTYETIPEKKINFSEVKSAYVAPQFITPAETYVPSSMPTIVPAETYLPPSFPAGGFDMWVQVNDNYTPGNAFRAGQDTDLSSLYICRAFHNGHMLPGKANPSHRCAYVCCDGQEIQKYNYEILVGDRYHWVPAHNGIVPPRAVEGGRTASGEVLYIARSHYNGSLTPGKLHPSHGCIYIPFGGREIRLTNYEVLVRW